MAELWSPDRYRDAYRFAAEAHQGQLVRGTNLPYLMHLSLVAMEVMAALIHEPAHDGDLAVQCALLHDILEDTAIAAAQLEARFGASVLAGVQALSKDPGLPKEQQIPDSLARIQRQPPVIGMIKLADRITNLQPPPPDWSRARRERYRDDAWAIYHALSDSSAYLAARLQDHIERYEHYLE